MSHDEAGGVHQKSGLYGTGSHWLGGCAFGGSDPDCDNCDWAVVRSEGLTPIATT